MTPNPIQAAEDLLLLAKIIKGNDSARAALDRVVKIVVAYQAINTPEIRASEVLFA